MDGGARAALPVEKRGYVENKPGGDGHGRTEIILIKR
jgi:hypothetical protein